MKAKVTTGTAGVASGLTEAQLNLSVSCQLRDELIARGYNVLMIRESQDVDISNAQRAQMATAAGADIFVRIHANGSDDASVSGVLTMSPTASNPYVAALYASCHSLSACVVDAICAQTGAINRGIYETDTMSGINWTTMPVTIVEMGYMTNPTEDLLMASEDYQVKLVTGIANGIDTYFGR
jgi:N-acetylmuramoyl-L-alanine amidase